MQTLAGIPNTADSVCACAAAISRGCDIQVSVHPKVKINALDKCKSAMHLIETNGFDIALKDPALLTMLRTMAFREAVLSRTQEDKLDCNVFNKLKEALAEDTPDAIKRLVHSELAEIDAASNKATPEFLLDNKTRLPFQGEIEDFRNMSELVALHQRALGVTDTTSFLALKDEWQSAQKIITNVCSTLGKICDDIQTHIKTRQREITRRQQREAQEQRTQQLRHVREEAKKAADAIKAKSKPAEIEAVIFNVDLAAIDPVHVVKGTWENPDWSQPVCIQDIESLTLLLGTRGVQNALVSWAAQYGKTNPAKQTGRAQFPLQTKFGKEEITAFFEEHGPQNQVDIAKVEGGKVFMESVWLVGYTSSMQWCGLAPNASAFARIMALGEVPTLQRSVSSLLSGSCLLKEGLRFSTFGGIHAYTLHYSSRVCLIRAFHARSRGSTSILLPWSNTLLRRRSREHCRTWTRSGMQCAPSMQTS